MPSLRHCSRFANAVAGAAALVLGVSRLPVRAEVEPAVLQAEAARVEVIRAASQCAVSIFAGDAGGGSGVLVSPDGYALTNFHVVEPAGPAMRCGLNDGGLYDAVLVGLDPTGDVALVRLLGRDDFPHATPADSDRVQPGDFCFAAGNPFLLATDLQPSISVGIVSGVHRYQFPAGTILEYADCLQVDAAINPGNSGGGLFDEAGRLIGVNGRASFEKRGRVNVGVGYAISMNQVRNFFGLLKGGRLVDHATLGATVSSSADGRVLVSDILQSSDAWRRGLRYDDEIVALAGRPIRTVNAFKNVLGTLPAGWRVPLAYRRAGRRHEIVVRLAAVHSAAALAALVSGEPEPPPRGPKDDAPRVPADRRGPPDAARLPESVRGLYDPRPGFVNFHFNTLERDRVAAAIAKSRPATMPGAWEFAGARAEGGRFQLRLADDDAVIDLPTGTSRIDPAGDLAADASPPGSGGLLAALAIWRQLVRSGPTAVGGTTYWGTAPRDPQAFTAGFAAELVDVLEVAVSGMTAEVAVDATGIVTQVELWQDADSDSCLVRFGRPHPDDPRGLPTRFDVSRGNEVFGAFIV
ncbi:MAG: Periplasmic serine endoprotease DegP precursor, partial [Planctomycetota bacterium]